MTTYSLGQQVTLSAAVVDDNGNPIDTAPVLTLTKPDATTATPAVVHVGSAGTGTYASTFAVDQVNDWSWAWTVMAAVVVDDHGQFDVLDPPPIAYADLGDLKEGLLITAADRDARLTSLLLSASRAIDDACGGRRFWLDPAPVARKFGVQDRIIDTEDGQKLLVDDIGSETGLIVAIGSGATFATIPATEYQTGPDNAIIRREPITWLLRPFGIWRFMRGQQIQITAQWGYPAIPAPIAEATLLLANRRYKRRSSPEGVMGSAEWGVIRVSRSDPDVVDMIQTYQLQGSG